MNRFAKLTSRKPSLHYEWVDKIYPEHASALSEAVLIPPNFQTMRYLCRNQYDKVDMEKELDVNKRKTGMNNFVLPNQIFSLRLSTG